MHRSPSAVIKMVMFYSRQELVVITPEDSFHILRFNQDSYNTKVKKGVEVMDKDVGEAFDVITEVSDKQVFLTIK